MAIHHITVTLGATAAAISTPSAGSPSINCKEIQLESESGNATVYIGGSSVSSTDYGRTLSAGTAAAITIRPAANATINLASTYLLGTASQKVHVLYVTP